MLLCGCSLEVLKVGLDVVEYVVRVVVESVSVRVSLFMVMFLKFGLIEVCCVVCGGFVLLLELWVVWLVSWMVGWCDVLFLLI